MAVKVMVAPAIARGELEKPKTARAAQATPKAGPRPKRRRSAVYDADGNEVLITLICLKCQKIRPLSQFGLRKMADGSIRNQPWCRTCRSGTAARPDEAAAAGESSVSGESPPPSAPADSAPPPSAAEPKRPGMVAAEVAAALWAGRR